jgi:DNA-directed RNA polymerase specialized sigma24 family protein
MSDPERALAEDIDPGAGTTADTPVPTSETRDVSDAEPEADETSSSPPSEPPSEPLLDEPDDCKPDDTEIPAELFGSPRNDAPRTAFELATYWTRLSTVDREPIIGYLVAVKGSAPDVAEDLVSEALERAMGLSSWPSDDTKLQSWVKGCARYVFREHYRADTRRGQRIEISSEVVEAFHADPSDHDGRDTLREFLAIAAKLVREDPSLAPAYQLCLRIAETGESIEDAARALGLVPGKMRMRVTRLREQRA